MGLTASKSAPPGSAIVVTGCDTGFGFGTALDLVRDGFKVYAGCLTAKGQLALREEAAKRGLAAERLVAFSLDVTKDEDCKKCWEMVDKEEGGLYALVNNAGILALTYFEYTQVDTFKKVFDVNTFGAVRMFKWLLPSLRKYSDKHPDLPPARIVVVSSVMGRIIVPSLSAYGASKHALEAICDSLRRELRMFGQRIEISMIEPFSGATSIADHILKSEPEQLANYFKSGIQPELRDAVFAGYGGEEAYTWKIAGAFATGMDFNLMPAQRVVDSITAQVKASSVGLRVPVTAGFGENLFLFIMETLPGRLLDWALFETAGAQLEKKWQAHKAEQAKK